jgi:hypothetical protein
MIPHPSTFSLASLALALVLAPAPERPGADADSYAQATCRGAIGDRVWRDLDGDGIQDEGEPGLEGVRLELRDTEGTFLEETVSNAAGFYAFMRRCAGRYVVVIDPQSVPLGLVPSPCDVGDDNRIDSECSPARVSLAGNFSTVRGIDFGFRLGGDGVIGDFVWLDADCDGFQDIGTALGPGGEGGIPEVRIILRDDMGVIVAEATTNDGGRYAFTGLPDGRYFVEVDESTLPQGLLPSPCDPGLTDERDNDCTGVEVVLGASLGGQATVVFDFGYRRDPCGGQGCSHGFWKNHPEAWPAPFTPSTPFSEVFEDAFPGLTLLQVLEQGGGGLDALGRQVVAALLNAASAPVDFALSVEEVIGLFDEIWPIDPGDPLRIEMRKDYFEFLNDQTCPL